MATMSRADELKAELARIEAEESQTEAVEGTIDGEGGIYLTIRGEEFECRRVSTSWQMMQFAKAQREANITIPKGLPEDSPKREELSERRNKAGMQMMALLLDTCMILLKPHERQRFTDFMDSASADDKGLEPGELETAIGEVIAAAGGEKGKAEQNTSAQSSPSSGTIDENVRVISFNKGGAGDVSDKAPANVPAKRSRSKTS